MVSLTLPEIFGGNRLESGRRQSLQTTSSVTFHSHSRKLLIKMGSHRRVQTNREWRCQNL